MDVRPFTSVFTASAFLVVFCLARNGFACIDTSSYLVDAGPWGGRGAALVVHESGVKIEFDCAFGYIDLPLTADRNGQFLIEGRFVRELGGPGRPSDAQPKSTPALFSGLISTGQLVLFVELPEEHRKLGPYTLNKSQQAELEKCL